MKHTKYSGHTRKTDKRLIGKTKSPKKKVPVVKITAAAAAIVFVALTAVIIASVNTQNDMTAHPQTSEFSESNVNGDNSGLDIPEDSSNGSSQKQESSDPSHNSSKESNEDSQSDNDGGDISDDSHEPSQSSIEESSITDEPIPMDFENPWEIEEPPQKIVEEPSENDEPSEISDEEPDESDGSSETSGEEPDESDGSSETSGEEPDESDGSSETSEEEPDESDGSSETSEEEPDESDGSSETSEEEPDESNESSETSEEEPDESIDPTESDDETSENSSTDVHVIEVSTDTETPEKPIVDANKAYTSEAVYSDIDNLCERYPELISQSMIGYSVKHKPLICVTLGNGDKKACVVAGIHSREHITISFTMRCIEEYAKAYVANKKYGGYNVRKLLDEYTLYFIPMCNPDGTDISTAGEKPLVTVSDFDGDSYKLNANGVNLNRNFPINWDEFYGSKDYLPGDEVYPGKSAGSEPETEAIISLCEENDFLWLLDMHVLGNGIFWKDDYSGEIVNDRYMAYSIAIKCGYYLFGNTYDPSQYSGGLENWFRYKYGRPSFCIEMIPYSQAYFSDTYYGYNSYFEEAINWKDTKYTYLEAMACM